MNDQLIQIRDQQRETWDKFSPGWKKWDEKVLGWLAPVGLSLIDSARLRPDSHLLDVAAGTGEPGLTAAKRLTQGHVTCTDLSEGMLSGAAASAARAGLRNFETRQCDVGEMPFGDNAFDAITCRFGFMFFPSIERSLAEMTRVAKPGARICSAIWNAPARNSWATTIMSVINSKLDLPAPPPGAPGLFRCAAPGMIADGYRLAGLKDVTETEVSGELTFPSAEQYWEFMTQVAAPVVAGLAKADEPTRAAIREEVLARARGTTTNGSVRLSWSALAITGEK